MTNAIKQIFDTDGEPMMEAVVYSDCSAVDMEAIHAEALIENDEFDGIIRDGLTPEQRAIQTRREGMDIYGVRFAEMYAQDYAEAMKMNEALEMNVSPAEEIKAMWQLNQQGQFKYLPADTQALIVDFCHEQALELNAEIDDGKTMDMYHKWNTAPTAQIRRDMLAAAHAEALAMDARINEVADVRIEIFKRESDLMLLITPIKFSVAESLASAMEGREVITAFGTCVTAIDTAPGDELVSLGLYFDNLDSAVFITLNHLIKANKPIPIVIR
ncbi:TPA: hypothetical protein QCI16_002074 [Enterobacter ludwigii]|nr:hypothetical protein [Enterobacter ludwigii]HDR2597917.1 hypothetical protein [Enterobacter ludwigii]